MKMFAPKDVTAAFVGGVEYHVDADHSAEIADEHVPSLITFGWSTDAPEAPAKGKKS